jgi:anti-anti-sigma factor
VDVTIQSHSQQDVYIIAFDSQYHSDDGSAMARVRDALANEVITAAQSRVVVDLTNTEYFGSVFVGLLFALREHVKALGGRLAACVTNANCKEVLAVTQFDRVCPVFESQSEAVASVVG